MPLPPYIRLITQRVPDNNGIICLKVINLLCLEYKIVFNQQCLRPTGLPAQFTWVRFRRPFALDKDVMVIKAFQKEIEA
jgi:hypothetical protein